MGIDSDGIKNEFKVRGDQLVDKVKEIIHAGNVRSITIRDKQGHDIVRLPLTIGVVGAVVSPALAAVGAIAALVTECTIVVERETDKPDIAPLLDPDAKH